MQPCVYGIVHVKVDFIPVLKMCVLPILGRFVWTTSFGQCDPLFLPCCLHQNFRYFLIKNGLLSSFIIRKYLKYLKRSPSCIQFWTFEAVLYFCQFLLNKSPNFHDFFSLLFETVFYSKQSSIKESTVF